MMSLLDESKEHGSSKLLVLLRELLSQRLVVPFALVIPGIVRKKYMIKVKLRMGSCLPALT